MSQEIVNRRARASTISDVARFAGVSVSTASKALNGRVGASPDTRARVQAAAKHLQFRPNAVARALTSGRTFLVGLLTTDSFGRFSLPILLGAEDALGAGNINVVLCDSRDEKAREATYLEMLIDRGVDGVILTGRRRAPRPSLGNGLPYPVVYATTPSVNPLDCSVVVDEAGGARMAVEHLLETGRSRLAHITGPRHNASAGLRAAAAKRAASRGGAPLVSPVLWGTWSEAWGRRATNELLVAQPSVDGIFCGSDQIARGVADALRDAGRRIPKDVAIVGYDNWDVMVEGSRPALTTVDMKLESVGRIAASYLLGALEGRPVGGKHKLACDLVIRASTVTVIPQGPDATSVDRRGARNGL
jgi:LacI family transcriptional regulator